jgi:hypothetical protein
LFTQRLDQYRLQTLLQAPQCLRELSPQSRE